MINKKRSYKGLQFKSVWFEDTSLTSPEYFNISDLPIKFTAGVNIFKFKLNRNIFNLNSNIDLEILDARGDTIYYEILDFLDGDTSIVVGVHIQSGITPPGICTITLIGDAINTPPEWIGRPNIKWVRSVSVNPYQQNSSEIIFLNTPVLDIVEQVGVHLDRKYTNTQFPTYTGGSVKYYSYNKQPAIQLTGGKFNSNMVGGTITVNTPINATPIPNFPISTPKFSSKITKVLSDTTALLKEEYTYYNTSSLLTHTYDSFDYSSYTLEYEDTPKYVATQNSESYAIIEVKGLTPKTGNISRIKLFANNNGTVGTWEQINDIRCTTPELFTAGTSSVQPDDNITLFTSQSYIDTYWDSITYIDGELSTTPTLIWHTSSMMDSMDIQNSAEITSSNSVSIAKIKSAYQTKFIQNLDYKFTIDAISDNTSSSAAVLSIYLSGSAFVDNIDDTLNRDLPINLGKKIGELRTTSQNARFNDNMIKFTADNSGSGVLILAVENGNWKVSNIRTTPDSEFGYTPNYIRIRTLVPTSHKSNNQLSFKAEYYNIDGVRSKQSSYAYNIDWEGGNRYIDGEYSMLTGSLYVADSLKSGVAISGYKNTGFIRSLGYEGFNTGLPGFLLWSGSAIPGSAGTKGGVPYSGVGLELYANTNNYFRYATNPSELDVRTQTFFLGSTSPANFISGSAGKLQISSSKFELSADGDVTASDATFRGNSTADFYQWRNVVIAEQSPIPSGIYNNISTYTYGGKTYCSLNLTGSYDPRLAGNGPSIFVRLNEIPSAPIAAIKIHPDSWNTGDYFQYYGGFIILEGAATTKYLQLGILQGEASGLGDANIGYDLDDWFVSALKTVTINATSYSNCFEIKSGTRVFLAQGMNDWRIFSVTSYNGIIPDFYSGIQITSGNISVTGSIKSTSAISGSTLNLSGLPTSNPGGSGIVWNDGGILKIT